MGFKVALPCADVDYYSNCRGCEGQGWYGNYVYSQGGIAAESSSYAQPPSYCQCSNSQPPPNQCQCRQQSIPCNLSQPRYAIAHTAAYYTNCGVQGWYRKYVYTQGGIADVGSSHAQPQSYCQCSNSQPPQNQCQYRQQSASYNQLQQIRAITHSAAAPAPNYIQYLPAAAPQSYSVHGQQSSGSYGGVGGGGGGYRNNSGGYAGMYRVGDWKCPVCGFMNFTWRRKCHSCNEGKPVEIDGGPPSRASTDRGGMDHGGPVQGGDRGTDIWAGRY